jgi:hypothetical protein
VRVIVRRDAALAAGDNAVLVPRGDRLHLFSAASGDAIGHTGDRPDAGRSIQSSSFIH